VKVDAPRPLSETGVSIIIPTLNGGRAFIACLEGIEKQQGAGPVELIVVDSGSGDGTLEAAARAGARILEVDRSAFNHGMARDLGARSAGGEIYVFTVQDARPADEHWLRFLVEPLLEGAAAAASRILPRPESSPLARRTAFDSIMASDAPFEADPSKVNLEAMTPEETRRFARFDDISSGVRAEVYRDIPFRPVPMAEDLQWALDALRRGHRIRYAPRSMVYHSHEYAPIPAYRRYREDARALREILGLAVRRGLCHAIKGYVHEVMRDLRFLLKENPWALLTYGPYSLILRGFQIAGQWKGSP
jgi:rhamnosyltransferase